MGWKNPKKNPKVPKVRTRVKPRKLVCLVHDSGAQQNWPGNEDTFRKISELVRKTTAHSTVHQRQHLQFLLERRSEVHRNQY